MESERKASEKIPKLQRIDWHFLYLPIVILSQIGISQQYVRMVLSLMLITFDICFFTCKTPKNIHISEGNIGPEYICNAPSGDVHQYVKNFLGKFLCKFHITLIYINIYPPHTHIFVHCIT